MSSADKLPSRATDERTVQKFQVTASGIGGATTKMKQALAEVEAELKKDIAGQKEYEKYLQRITTKKQELQKRIDANKCWLDEFEKGDRIGAAEQKYKNLISQIETIYQGAKEFHGKGIELLVKDFQYHLAYKRWNDTFTAVPFKPK
ncbi:flagellar associated protein [Haematococcus lacustris]